MMPFQPGEGHLHHQRYGRVEVCHSFSSDPGVEFVIARSPSTLDAMIPSPVQLSKQPWWKGDNIPREDVLFPSTSLASGKSTDPDSDAPAAVVQITSFACGGTAIAVGFSHPLADAQLLAYFVRDWANVSSAMLSNESVPTLSPHFQPSLIDATAAGDIDVSTPSPEVLETAFSLPCHRYDWWASAPNCPWPSVTTDIPATLADHPAAEEPAASSTPIPWKNLDATAPISHAILHFSSAQIDKIRDTASTLIPVSRHDALLTQIWSAIIRARGLSEDDDLVHCDVSFGLCKRIVPPLGENFLGSPIMIADMAMKGREASSSVAAVAAKIRATLAVFTPEKIAALIYSVAYEVSPARN